MLVKSISGKRKFRRNSRLQPIISNLVLQVWGGFGIVIIAIYTAKLAAFMVELPEDQTAKTLKGIIVG